MCSSTLIGVEWTLLAHLATCTIFDILDLTQILEVVLLNPISSLPVSKDKFSTPISLENVVYSSRKIPPRPCNRPYM